MSGWRNVVYTYNGILFSISKEGNLATCDNMNETWEHYAKWDKSEIEKQIFHYPLKWDI